MINIEFFVTGTYSNDTSAELLEESSVEDYQSACKTMGYLSADAKLRGVRLYTLYQVQQMHILFLCYI